MKYNVNQAIEVLENTPHVINTLLKNLSDEWIFNTEGGDTWSAFDIVGHLIHGEKTDWIPRLYTILNPNAKKIFQPFDRYAQFQLSKGRTLLQMLDEFKSLRLKNIKTLKELGLTDTQLNLKGIHPELGEVTASQLLACWVTHDLGHIAQICRVMAKQYKSEVGPWIQYIPILNV